MAQNDIQGQVLDASGNPVEGAIVELTKSYQSSPTDEQVVRRTTTDNNGNYIFDYHPDGDGSTQEWHVSCYNYDGTAYVNSENNPGVTADLSASAIPDSALTQDMVAWWRFEDGDARDYTNDLDATFADPTAYDGTVNGATFQSTGGVTDFDNGTDSGNFDFDGTDDNINNTGLTFSSGTITVMGWLNNDSGTNQYLICNQSSTSDGFILYNNNSGVARALMRDSSGSASLVDGSSIPSDTWTHLALSWDGSTLELYEDGANQGSTSLGSHNYSGQDIVIGYDPTGNSNHTDGQIDDCRVYNRSLTDSEVSDIYNRTNP